MIDFAPWSWHQSLGAVSPAVGRRYRVRRILFASVEERCRKLGLTEGDTVRCRHRDHDGVEVELSCGTVQRLDLNDARFVEIEPTEEDVAAG